MEKNLVQPATNQDVYSLSHKKGLTPTYSSNNTTKTLSGGTAGRVNPPFL
jgi:hypothetical protein